jgi:hypothetical protein
MDRVWVGNAPQPRGVLATVLRPGAVVYHFAMSAITRPPKDIGDFGLNFDYSIWTPNTDVYLCNVPWDATYRDVVWWDNYDESFEAIVHGHKKHSTWTQIHGLTYCAQGRPIRIDVPFSKANTYNYLIARNNEDPVNSRNTFYYFITSVEYVAPNTTEITVQLDVWQSYMHEWEITRCYVERSHLGIAAEEAWTDNGRRYLTAPEGLDTGAEYIVGDVWREFVAATPTPEEGQEYDTANYDVVVTSTVDLEEDYGSADDPKFTTAKGSIAEGLPNGCAVYVMPVDAFTTMAEALSYAPWVAQGIVSITAIPNGVIDWDKLEGRKTKLPDVPHDGKSAVNADVFVAKKGFGDAFQNNKTIELAAPFRTDTHIPDRYKHLWKFYTAPYMWFELTTFTGTPLMIRPESIVDWKFNVTQWAHVVPPNPRIMFTVNNLNASSFGVTDYWNGRSEHFDVMTGFANFPTFTLTNNSYLMYTASNAHQIAYQRQSAEWGQQKALRGASTQFAQAQASMQQGTDMTNLGNAYNTQMAQYNANQQFMRSGVNAIGSGVASALGGNILGGAINALTQGYNMGNEYGTALENNRMRAEQASAMTSLKNSYGKYFADSNLQMAKFAANGDYANAIAGINAKIQDSDVIAPTTSGQTGGDAFMLSAEGWQIVLRQKLIDVGTMVRIGEFWLRYGYAMNVFNRPPKNFRCMENFTYWQMKETYIRSATCPEGFKQSIRGIFEKGVTVWHKTFTIGSALIGDNEPLKGIHLDFT